MTSSTTYRTKADLAELLDALNESLGLDYTKLKDLESAFLTLYKMTQNPIPLLKAWLKRNRLDIQVGYIEMAVNSTTSANDCDTGWIKRKVSTRRAPFIIVAVKKRNALAVSVTIRYACGLDNVDVSEYTNVTFL